MPKKAKATKVTTETPAPKARRRARVARVRARRANPASNPPLGADLMNVVLPGAVAYAGTRVLARIVYSVTAKRWPKFAKHAHALAGVVAAGGAWFGAHRIQRIAHYHDGIVTGAAIAAAQGIAQAYLPAKYRWLLADPQATTPALTAGQIRTLTAPAPRQAAPADNDEYAELERAMGALEESAPPVPSGGGGSSDDDLATVLGQGEDPEDLYTGAFAQN